VRRWIVALAVIFSLCVAAAGFAQTDGGTRMLRTPDIDKDTIVFVYGGDLWVAGTELAFGDHTARLLWVEVASGKVTVADRGTRGDITDYRWSPDSRWIVYTKAGASKLSAVWVYSLDRGKADQLTSGFTNDSEPVFDPQGRYLYFLSNRDFNLTFSGFEFDYVYTAPTRIYVAVLAKDGPALFLPESDEESIKEAAAAGKPAPQRMEPQKPPKKGAPPPAEEPAAGSKEGKDGKENKEGKDAAADTAPATKTPVKIDVDGFELRVRAIPGPSGDYQNLAAASDAVFYINGTGPAAQLKMYDLKEQKESVVLPGVAGYDLSADGKKILYSQGETYGIVDAKPGQKVGDGKLGLDKLQLQIDPRAA